MEVKITNYGGIITSIIVPDKDGKMADVVLDGARLSAAKIESTGYRTLYDYVKDALRDILERKI